MFERLKGFAMAVCGIEHEKPTPVRDWKQKLRDNGYIFYERHGCFHWFRPATGSQSGRYTTMLSAEIAAQTDFDAVKQEGVCARN